jgi:cytochrome c oxidase cbb3-type subunit 3
MQLVTLNFESARPFVDSRVMHNRKFVRAIAFALAASFSSAALGQSASADYSNLCSGCHGASFNLLTASPATPRAATELADIIRNGLPAKGMPAFGARLSAAQVDALAQMARAAAASRGGALGSTVDRKSMQNFIFGGFGAPRSLLLLSRLTCRPCWCTNGIMSHYSVCYCPNMCPWVSSRNDGRG